MATPKMIDPMELHIDGACEFRLPIDQIPGDGDKSELVASYAVAMASLVPRYPSLSFTVTAEGIEARIAASVLLNDSTLHSLMSLILELGDEQHRAFCEWSKAHKREPVETAYMTWRNGREKDNKAA